MDLQNLKLNNVTVATPSELDRIRRPTLIFTDSYLEDPITYRPDDRFQPDTVVQQFQELPDQLTRDFADFLRVDINGDEPQLLTIPMVSGLTSRTLYNNILGPRSQFKQLGVTR